MKNSEVVDRILEYHPKLIRYKGCDTYKCGNPEDECKGVAVALVPTADVIKRAHEAGCNLLIAHEPTFYTSPDFAGWQSDFDNKVVDEKQKLIKEYGITIWRDHDHMHANMPDSIFSGVIRELGWEKYYIEPKSDDTPCCFKFEMPETKIGDIARHLKETLHLNGMKYIGNLEKKVTKVAIVGHLNPGFGPREYTDDKGFYHDYAIELMKAMETEGIQLIIPGEIIEWTILSYIRDANAMGGNLACLNIGHFNLEELGMKDFTGVVRGLLDDVPNPPQVVYIPTEDGFDYL